MEDIESTIIEEIRELYNEAIANISDAGYEVYKEKLIKQLSGDDLNAALEYAAHIREQRHV